MSSGTYTWCSACCTTGMPRPAVAGVVVKTVGRSPPSDAQEPCPGAARPTSRAVPSPAPSTHTDARHAPLFHTETVLLAASIVTRSAFMDASRVLLSAALTRISSKILYRPGTNVTVRDTIFCVAGSSTHIACVCFCVEPTARGRVG